MTEELLAVDDQDNPVGLTLRPEAVTGGIWRRAVGGIVLDPVSGLVLCHRRSVSKDERPGLWVATFGGKSRPTEINPIQTAKRELFEEFGIYASEADLQFVLKYRSEQRHQYEYVFRKYADHQTKLLIDTEEVDCTSWLSIQEVTSKLASDKNWYSYGYEMLVLRN